MFERCGLKNVVIFIQTLLSFVLSKIRNKKWLNVQYREFIHVEISSHVENKQVVEITTGWYESE